MNEADDFGKRLFIDFVDARLRARGIDRSQSRRARQESSSMPPISPGSEDPTELGRDDADPRLGARIRSD